LGLQLRYEVTRKFAPYIEISSERLLGETANIAEKNNRDRSDTRIVAGVRLLF
jgi:copper resistance protein B